MKTLSPSETYNFNGYEICDDVEYFHHLWNITPGMYETLEKAEKAAVAAKRSGYERIAKAIKKYPRVPVFKDLMVAYYTNKQEIDKASEWIEILLRDHPDFLMGYVGKALEHFENDAFEKMSEIMGGNFELKDLFPDRQVFFKMEFLKMQYIALIYFGATGQFQEAFDRLDIMHQVGPDEIVTQVSREYLSGELSGIEPFEDYERSQKKEEFMEQFKSTQVAPQPETTKTTPPEFVHDEVRQLYDYGFELPYDSIIEIATLPRESLIKDLETMLDDSIERYTYLTEDNWGEGNCFVTHAIFLLAEINALESAPKIYKVLSQSGQYLEDFLDDVFRTEVHDPFYKLLSGEPEKLVAFIKQPGIFTIPRIMGLSLLKEIVVQKPAQKLKVLGYFEQIIDFFIASKPEDNVRDNLLMDALIVNLLLMKAVNFLPKIRRLIDRDMVLSFEGLPNKELKAVMNSPGGEEIYKKLPLQSMIKTYETLSLYEDDDEWEDDNDWQKQARPNTPNMTVIKSEKVGRNDLCPCGSGKKYKKCCLAKGI